MPGEKLATHVARKKKRIRMKRKDKKNGRQE